MQIDYFEYTPKTSHTPVQIGLQLIERDGQKYANLFDLGLGEKGARLSDNLWTAAQAVIDQNAPHTKLDEVKWSYAADYQTSKINFTTLDGLPAKIDLSNPFALTHAEHGRNAYPHSNAYSIERYKNEFVQGALQAKWPNIERERICIHEPRSSFVIPTNHPNAKDGIYYYSPFAVNHEMSGQYLYVFADTTKLIEAIHHGDPKMMDHARYKFSYPNETDEETVARYFEYNRFPDSSDIGNHEMLSYYDGKFSFNGQAGMLIALPAMGTPFIPVAIEKLGLEGRATEIAGILKYEAPRGENPFLEPSPNFF